MGGRDQPRRNDLEKGGILVGGRMLHLGTNKIAAPIQTSFRTPMYHPVLSKQELPSSNLSHCHLLLLWVLNSQYLTLVEETVSPEVCKPNRAAAAISLAPSSGQTPDLCLQTLLKFRHTFSYCYSFFLVSVPANVSPNYASPLPLLGYLPPTPIKTVHQKCFIVY